MLVDKDYIYICIYMSLVDKGNPLINQNPYHPCMVYLPTFG